MSKTKKFVVIDFEGKSTARPYNLGIVVGDKHGNIIRTYQLTFSETFQENSYTFYGMQGDKLTTNNIEYIYSHKEEFTNVTINNFIRFFFALIDYYKISEVWAYNMAFDKSALRRLIGDNYFIELCKKVAFYDIVPMIMPVLLTKKYVKFCKTNRYITPAGNLQTKAEIVYRYLFNNVNYIERHLGLQDAIDEYNILCKVFKRKKKIVKMYTTKPKAYIQLKKFCESQNIDI